MISIWEKESLLKYDIIIVGAGITGLSAAASVKEKRPNISVLVIEQGSLPTGASTRNAGFACFGSISELKEDIQSLGEQGMSQLVEKRWNGIQKTKSRLGPTHIDFDPCGGFELCRVGETQDPATIQQVNDLLKDIFGKDVFTEEPQKIKDYGFHGIEQLIFNRFEGSVDTGKMMANLWDYCQRLGVRIITGTSVVSYQAEGQDILLKANGFNFRGKALGLCTNAFTKNLVKNLELDPGRGLILLISTKKPFSFKGTFHYDQGYYYFRELNGKILFGGGRNLDPKTESTTEFGINQKIRKRLIDDLERMIIPGQDYKIEMEWSGIMAFGHTKEPIVQQVEERVYAGVRLGGMGVAIGSVVGEELADLILNTQF